MGNVLAVVTDKVIGQDIQDDPAADYYAATVSSANDYYPFGWTMPGRKFVGSDGYKYGFNGMEMDNEVKGQGNSYDFGARIYDNRVGRWLALDPLAQKYSSLSPYCFVTNSPLRFIDPDGKQLVDPDGNIAYKDGKWTKYATEDMKELGRIMMQTVAGKELFQEMIKSKYQVTMRIDQGPAPNKKNSHVRGRTFADRHWDIDYNFTRIEGIVSIVIYEDEIEAAQKKIKRRLDIDGGINYSEADRLRGKVSKEQAIAATTGHEIVHAIKDANHQTIINVNNGLGGDKEKLPEEKALEILQEYIKMNKEAEKREEERKKEEERRRKEIIRFSKPIPTKPIKDIRTEREIHPTRKIKN